MAQPNCTVRIIVSIKQITISVLNGMLQNAWKTDFTEAPDQAVAHPFPATIITSQRLKSSRVNMVGGHELLISKASCSASSSSEASSSSLCAPLRV